MFCKLKYLFIIFIAEKKPRKRQKSDNK